LPGPTTSPSKTSITDKNVIDLESVNLSDAPEGWDYSPIENGNNRWVSQDGQLEISENPETGKVELFENGEKISEHSEVAYAFAESDRRDVEQSLTKESKKVVARLRREADDAKTAKDATPADIEKAEEALDSALFNDPDSEETLDLVDSVAPNPESLGEDVTISEEERQDMMRSPITGKHMDENGEFTEERKALHEEIIRRALEGSTPVKNPTQWMNGGGPGSGKSSLTQGDNKDLTGYDSNSVLLDPDEIKQELPEVKEALARLEAGEELDEDIEWAGFSHEESSYLAKRIHLAALERHHNVIIDGTGDGGLASVRKKVQLARKNGYKRVEANYLYLDPDEGIKRAKERQARSFRKVPDTVIKSTYETISTIFPELEKEQLFDSLRLFDNNKKPGQQAELILEQKDGETEIKDEDAYNRFLRAKASDAGQPPPTTPPTPPVTELPEEGPEGSAPKIRASEVTPGTAVVDTDFDVQKVGTFVDVNDSRVPPQLFHVTTNREGVVNSGELQTTSADGKGFGGADRNVVSFSGTKEQALQMHADLKDYVRFRQAKTEQEVKDIFTDLSNKYDIPAPRRDGMLAQLDNQQWMNGDNRHNTMAQFFNERESSTGIKNPVILNNDSWETMSPDSIALLRVPKEKVADTEAAISVIGNDVSSDEFRVHGNIPVSEENFVDVDSLADPDLDDVTVVPVSSLTELQLNSELGDIQEEFNRLQFVAQGTEGPEEAEVATEEMQRLASRYEEIQSELGRRSSEESVDNDVTDTIESINTRIESIDAQIGRRIGQGRDTEDLEERQRALIEKREALQRGEQLDAGEAGQELDGGTEGTVPSGVAGTPSRSARVERRGDSLRDVSGNVVATRISEPSSAEELRQQGIRVVDLFEVDKEQAEFFRDSLINASDASAYGSSVTVHDLDYYQRDGVRMFLTQDGLGGVVLNGDEIVSGFMHPEASDRGQGAIISMVSSMVDQGGRRLDAYDTVLPGNYTKAGFRPVARLRWDDNFAPDNWDYDLYDRWSDGRPDIVFMTFDPERFGSEYDKTEGEYVDEYDTGAVVQQRALDGFDESKWVQIREQRRERARARRMETQQENDALKQEDGLLVGDVPRNDKDKPKNQALILSPIGQVVEVTSGNGRKMRFIKVSRDIWKRADKQDDHTRYRSHQIRRDKIEFVKTADTDVPSLDLPPRYHNSFRPVAYSIPRSSSSEELGRLRSIYQREADTADNSINAQRAEVTVKLIDRILAGREGRRAKKRETTSDRVETSRKPGRRMNAPLIEENDPESGSTGSYTPKKPVPDENGVTDNPELLANIFSENILSLAFTTALIDGRDSIALTFQTEDDDIFSGTRASVPVEAIRDALQLQGADTNFYVEAARINREVRSQRQDSTPVTPSDVLTRVSEQQELTNLYHTYEQYRNNLTEAVATEPADSPRITNINERMLALRSRIRRLELDGLRMTEPPSADSVQGFKWDSNTDPDIYRPELIMDALKERYPNAEFNDDGELVIGQAEYTVGGNRFKYEAIITRTDDELFYTYIRETNLSEEDPSKRYRSIRFGEYRHSARAVNNQASKALDKIFNRADRSSIYSWFNDRRRVREGRAPKLDVADEQGMPHHVRDQVLTRESIRKIQEAVDEDGITEEMIGSLYNYIRNFGNDTAVLQALYSTFGLDVPTLNRFVDAVNQHIHERDGLNSFSLWESDNGTPLAEGDFVTYIGDTNQRGFEGLGGKRAIVRIRSLEHRSEGYTYTDYVQIQLIDDNNTPIPGENYRVVSSHNLRLDRTAGNTDGSERRGPDAISMPLPVLTTRAGNRYAGQGRLGSVAPYVTEYDRDTLASPTVEIDGVDYPVQASRQSLLGPDLNNIYAQPKDLQTGDFIMHFDPATSSRRLAEVVNTETLDNGNIRITTVEPINLTSARVSQTEFGPDELVLDIYRYDPNFMPDDVTLTNAHVGRIADAVRNVNTSALSPETRATVQRMLNFELDNPELGMEEYREAMLDLLNNRTDEPRGQVSVAEAQRAMDESLNRGLPDNDAFDSLRNVSNVAAERSRELGVDSGEATPPSGGIPSASTISDRTLPEGYQRGPYGSEDGRVPGVDGEKFRQLLDSPRSAAKTRELRKIFLASISGRIYGDFALTDFRVTSGNKYGSWESKITDPSTGRVVGKAKRSYILKNDGTVDVHHDHIFISAVEDRGTGFASEFYGVSDNFYDSIGADINTITTVQDGSYAWGAANFTWAGRAGITTIIARLTRKAEQYDSTDPVTAERLRDLATRLGGSDMNSPDFPDPIDIASLLDPQDEENRAAYLREKGNMRGYKTLGREMLESTGWYGIRYLNPEMDPRAENRKNKKSLKEMQKDSAKEKAEASEETPESSDNDWPTGTKISSLSEISNARPGDTVELFDGRYHSIYMLEEDGSWERVTYGDGGYSSPLSKRALEITVDEHLENGHSVKLYSTDREREHIAKYKDGTLKIEDPSRESVIRALQENDTITLDAMYRGGLLDNGNKSFGTELRLSASSSSATSRGNLSTYSVMGSIVDSDGEVVGEFSREFRLDEDGRLSVYHSLLRITDDSYKGTGFGSEFTKQSDDFYRRMGVESVSVHAAWDGSYFWAIQGFEWDVEYAGGDKYDILSGVPGNLQMALEDAKADGRTKDVEKLQDIIERMAGLEIDDPNFPSVLEIAKLQSEDPALNDRKWMKEILYNTLWHGRKYFR
jgi:predicted ABC-type ATPase